ncbi:MAG TPA: DUF2628 domain-containing protein [Xanthobacteraceae bacterium]|jgi:hypothetical protein
MSVYTVHLPPSTARRSVSGPERFVFVRDGFSFWAFLLAPLWMLWHRLWLVFVGYCVLAVALQAALHAMGASFGIRVAAGALLAFLVGLEAATLRRVTLARRGWTNAGIVVGDDLESAEQRFFDRWIQQNPQGSTHSGSAPVLPAGRTLPVTTPGSGIVGLFPHPGGVR